MQFIIRPILIDFFYIGAMPNSEGCQNEYVISCHSLLISKGIWTLLFWNAVFILTALFYAYLIPLYISLTVY